MEIKTNIGELDTMVEIQSVEIGRGAAGQKTYTPHTHSRVWAKIERLSDEVVGNHNLEDGQSLTATIYKVKGMTTRWRVVVAGKSYEITAIDSISRFSPLCQVTLTAI